MTSEVPNKLKDTLQGIKDKGSEFNGLFKFENEKITDQYLVDMEVWVDAGSQEVMDKLQAASDNKGVTDYSEIAPLINGYARLVRFEPF